MHGEVCAICLEGYIDGSFIEKGGDPKPVSKLKVCGHIYHSECIRGWLESRNFCPLDRKVVN